MFRDVDSGMVGAAPASALYRCSPEILPIPPNAWKCQLDTQSGGAQSKASRVKWTESRIRVMKWAAVPTIQLVSKPDPEIETDTYEDYGHLFDFGESTGNKQSSGITSDRVQTLFEGLPGVPLPKNQLALLEDCWVVNVQWPHVYFVKGNIPPDILPSQSSVEDVLSLQELQIDELKPNRLCMVRVGTRLWKAVQHIEDKLASVIFVDNGKESEVSVSDLQPLPPSQRYIQPACIKARVTDPYIEKTFDVETFTICAMTAGPMQVFDTQFFGDIPIVRLYAAGGREICVG